MQDWSEGKLDVLVSTMNCGFNCGKCDEAMIAGGVRSVADAIQSIGRIRPKQQRGKKTPVTFWMTERSWDHWDVESNDWVSWEQWNKEEWKNRIDTMESNHFFDGFDTPEKRKAARNQLKFLYFQSGVKNIMEKDDICLRNQLYNQLGVKSNTRCQMCSVCNKSDVMSQQVTAARQRDAILKTEGIFFLLS